MKSLLLTGIGLRPPHYMEVVEKKPSVAWFEVHSENYFAEGGKDIRYLEQIRSDYPISLHGVGLSIGSADELNWYHLKKLRDLIEHINPCLVSEHLSWSSINGQYFHDLLPLPYTNESLEHIINRIQQVQEYLGRQILIENISSYVRFPESSYSEAEFLTKVALQAGCGILLDINNIYVSAMNLGFSPDTYLNSIPANLVQEIHLAGFTTTMINQKEVLIDSHNRPIVPAVWELYQNAVKRIGTRPTIIEWDNDIPSLDKLCLEAYRAEKIMRDIYAASKLTS